MHSLENLTACEIVDMLFEESKSSAKIKRDKFYSKHNVQHHADGTDTIDINGERRRINLSNPVPHNSKNYSSASDNLDKISNSESYDNSSSVNFPKDAFKHYSDDTLDFAVNHEQGHHYLKNNVDEYPQLRAKSGNEKIAENNYMTDIGSDRGTTHKISNDKYPKYLKNPQYTIDSKERAKEIKNRKSNEHTASTNREKASEIAKRFTYIGHDKSNPESMHTYTGEVEADMYAADHSKKDINIIKKSLEEITDVSKRAHKSALKHGSDTIREDIAELTHIYTKLKGNNNDKEAITSLNNLLKKYRVNNVNELKSTLKFFLKTKFFSKPAKEYDAKSNDKDWKDKNSSQLTDIKSRIKAANAIRRAGIDTKSYNNGDTK